MHTASIESTLSATAQYLASLKCHCGDESLGIADSMGSDAIVSLLSALREDGFNINDLHGIGGSPATTWTASPVLGGSMEQEGSEESGGLFDIFCVVLCIVMAGLASGLTQGLLSLDPTDMNMKLRSGTDEERRYVKRVKPFTDRHHLLLVTLMLWNASAAEAMPVFLGKLVPEWVAIIISVTAVLFLGEIIPASILTGPRGLQISAMLTPLVQLMTIIFYPLAYPIALGLDHCIGTHQGPTVYKKNQLIHFVEMQHEEALKLAESGHDEGSASDSAAAIRREDITIIDGALKYREMFVEQVMTPINAAFMIPMTAVLSYSTIYDIFRAGYSRIPVYGSGGRDDIVGLILAKDLIFVDPEDETPVSGFMKLFGRRCSVVWKDDHLGETLAMFQSANAHMAIVRDILYDGAKDPVYKSVGIVTLEDIVEEILGTEIEDEYGVKNVEERRNSDDQDIEDVSIRDMFTSRFRTTHSNASECALTEEQVQAASIYLSTNVPQLQFLFHDDMSAVKELVRAGRIVTLKRKSGVGQLPTLEDFLYRYGKTSNTCSIIIEGEVGILRGPKAEQLSRVRSTLNISSGGTEQNRLRGVDDDSPVKVVNTLLKEAQIKGNWSTLAGEALLSAAEGTYVADFTAYIISDEVKILSISKHSKGSVSLPNEHASVSTSVQRRALRKQLTMRQASLLANANNEVPPPPPTSVTATPNGSVVDTQIKRTAVGRSTLTTVRTTLHPSETNSESDYAATGYGSISATSSQRSSVRFTDNDEIEMSAQRKLLPRTVMMKRSIGCKPAPMTKSTSAITYTQLSADDEESQLIREN